MMIDYRAVIERYGIKPKGVLHVGGHVGHENQTYISLGFENRLYVEAQPDTFETLRLSLQGTGTHCVCAAASDRNGTAEFHVANNDQSSSLLRMKNHSVIYQDIVQNKTIEVETVRIDDLLDRSIFREMSFNFLNMDIQGAELLALSGAPQLLRKLDMINLEVNFDELYENAPHISTLDRYLEVFGFVRADTALFHATWGDAIYVKLSLAKIRTDTQ